MGKLNRYLSRSFFFFSLALCLLLGAAPAQAKYIGEDPPKRCQCESCNACETIGEDHGFLTFHKQHYCHVKQ